MGSLARRGVASVPADVSDAPERVRLGSGGDSFAVDDCFLGKIRAPVISGHLKWAVATDFTNFTDRTLSAILIEDSDFEKRQRRPHRAGFAHRIRFIQDRDKTFRHAIHFVESVGQNFVQVILVFEMEGCAPVVPLEYMMI